MVNKARVTIVAASAAGAKTLADARALADELGLPPAESADALASAAETRLVLTSDRLELHPGAGAPALAGLKPLWLDLPAIDTSTGPGRSLQNPLYKALAISKGSAWRPRVLDLTAGFGEDAWLLAAAGCSVTAIERHPAIFALLREALARAGRSSPQIAERITLIHADSRAWLEHHLHGPPQSHDEKATEPGGARSGWPGTPDAVYLDPMFPPGRKTAERKPLRVARALVGDDLDATALLNAALTAPVQRVVVKRPRRSPPLGEHPPVTEHVGKALRFDVYKPEMS